MQFKDVIGQFETKSRINKLVHSGRIPHAMMLIGPEGSGCLPLALALVQYIQCENKQAEDSCGECASCLKNQKFIHPDVHFTFPVVSRKSGEPPVSSDYITEWRSALAATPYMNGNDWLQNIEAENRQGNITVRECHEIIRGMNLKTYESGYKIQVIWLAEFLKEAGNTLLKIIEEPPAGTIFILVVENAEMILNTILSRTQIIKVNQVEDEAVKAELLHRFGMDEKAAQRIARIAEGNFNAALSMADGHENLNDGLLRRWLGYCFNLKAKPTTTNTESLLQWIDEISKTGRENQKIFLKYALFFLRECALVAYTGTSPKLDGEELEFAKRLSARLDGEQFVTLTKLISRLSYHIERNGNPKILFLSNSFKVGSVFKNEEVVID